VTDVLLLTARLVLAAAFAVAGAAKLADRDGSRRAALQLGVPRRLAGAAAIGLPCAELVVAALLLPSRTSLAGAAAALALLFAFSVALAVALARGRILDCHCFGRLHAAPAGWTTLARNAVLGLIAVFVLAAGSDDAGPDAVYVLAVLGLAVAVIWALLLRARPRRERRKPSPPAVEAHPFSLPTPAGEAVSLDDLLFLARPVLLVFAGQSIPKDLADVLAELQLYESHAVTVALVVESPEAAATLEHVLVDGAGAVRSAYAVDTVPAAVLVSSFGTRASLVATGVAAIQQLASSALAEETPPALWEDGLPIGEPMPRLLLPDLDGKPAELTELVSLPTVFLFWRPGCRPCRGLWEDVRAWERDRPEGAPQLVIVSTGSRADTLPEDFRSPTLIDTELSAGEAFRTTGAPMAVLVDRERRIASRVAVGPEAVLALLEP
jgi:hypothetical protein